MGHGEERKTERGLRGQPMRTLAQGPRAAER